jgi:hypothetical protein
MTAPLGATWSDLIAREPRLGDLAREVQELSRSGGPGFCANAAWYGYPNSGHPGIKPRLVALVGRWAERDDDVLRTSAAYDLAHRMLYDPLPPCQHEGMCDASRSQADASGDEAPAGEPAGTVSPRDGPQAGRGGTHPLARKDRGPLTGLYFLSRNAEGEQQYQGQFLARVDDRHYLVQLYEWLAGHPSTLIVVATERVATEQWDLFDDPEFWRAEATFRGELTSARERARSKSTARE